MSETPSQQSYKGACHCRQVKYSFSLPTRIEEQDVVQCNCSICNIHGYLFVYLKNGEITFDHDDDAVKAYRFASKQYPHYFCPNCGTSVYAKCDVPGQDTVAVNARTLEGVDIKALKIKEIDGRSV